MSAWPLPEHREFPLSAGIFLFHWAPSDQCFVQRPFLQSLLLRRLYGRWIWQGCRRLRGHVQESLWKEGTGPHTGSCCLQMLMKPNTASWEDKQFFSCWNLFFSRYFLDVEHCVCKIKSSYNWFIPRTGYGCLSWRLLPGASTPFRVLQRQFAISEGRLPHWGCSCVGREGPLCDLMEA